jgi:hypothetical protein
MAAVKPFDIAGKRGANLLSENDPCSTSRAMAYARRPTRPNADPHKRRSRCSKKEPRERYFEIAEYRRHDREDQASVSGSLRIFTIKATIVNPNAVPATAQGRATGIVTIPNMANAQITAAMRATTARKIAV